MDDPTPHGDDHVQLRPPSNKVDSRAPVLWGIKGLIQSAIGVLVVVGVTHLVPADVEPWMIIPLVASIALSLVATTVEPAWRYRVHRWEVTEDAVYASSGWWRQEWRIAPISRLQTIDTVRGPIQRMLGLASLTVTTASAAGPIVIEGLHSDTASALATRLTQISSRDGSDGT